jgi:hypothetical protein
MDQNRLHGRSPARLPHWLFLSAETFAISTQATGRAAKSDQSTGRFMSKDGAIVYPKFILAEAEPGDTMKTAPFLCGRPLWKHNGRPQSPSGNRLKDLFFWSFMSTPPSPIDNRSIAETAYDCGNRERAARPIASAETGYTTPVRLFSQTKNLTPGAKEELQSTLKRLRERLDLLQQFKGQP